MKEILKDGLKLFGRTIIINILSFFVVISIITLSFAVFSKEIGYQAFGTIKTEAESEEEKSELLYTHYNADGEDTKLAEYEAKGYTVTKSAIKETTESGKNATLLIAQLFTLGIFVSFIYPTLWEKGNKALNMVRIGKRAEDKLYGLKVGLISVIPSALVLLFLTVTKSSLSAKLPVALYKLANSSFYSVIELIAGNSSTFGELNILRLIGLYLPLLLVPAVAYIAYLIGYMDISLGEKFTYKKTNKRR